MIQQSHTWAYIWRNPYFKKTQASKIYFSPIYNSQDMETKSVSINRRIDKEYVVYIYIYMMEYYSAIRRTKYY